MEGEMIMEMLVTGGAGFIGSNLVERLVREGHNVCVIDNLNSGNENNLAAVRGKINFKSGNSGELESFGKKFDVIFHQGAYSSSPMYKNNPLLLAEVIRDFIQILEYAKKNGTKIVFASSSSVYNGVAPPHREDAPLAVTDYYTEGRIEMERLAKLYHDLYGVRVIALRYFSVYGPHETYKKQYANLITQFLWAMQKNEDVVVFGDGKQTRDFTYVDDVVEANVMAARAAASNNGYGVYNVGTGRNYTINEMISMLEKATGKKAKLKYVENKIKNYVGETLADVSKADKELGFRAKIALKEGIEQLIMAY